MTKFYLNPFASGKFILWNGVWLNSFNLQVLNNLI